MSETSEFRTFEEVSGLPLRNYTVLKDGKPIEIRTKGPSHSSPHPLDTAPTLFYNLDKVILFPDRTITKESNEPQAIEHRKRGKVVIYARDNFVGKLDIPGYRDWYNDETRVVTLYEDSGKNYTLTYYIIRK